MAQYTTVNRLSKSKDHPGLEYIINHIFPPLKLPQGSNQSLENDLALSQAVLDAAIIFSDQLPSDKLLLWTSSLKMLHNLKDSIRSDVMSAKEVESQINAMNAKDVLVYMIRAQNAAVVMRKLESETIFESFEVSPDPTAVMGAKGKLICSYPGPAIRVPDMNVDNATFPAELANFLVHMDQDVLDAAATRTKANCTVLEERDTTHPRYITELLTGILRGLGSIADIPRIRKRIGDDVLWDSVKLPWRRSPLWLVIRVALQTTLERSALGRTTYKSFILFFMARLMTLALDHDLSNDILHFMSTKIARRLFKLGPSSSLELSQMVKRATGLASLGSQDPPSLTRYSSFLEHEPTVHIPCFAEPAFLLPSNPSHHTRGTINNFLDTEASFLIAAHAAEPSLTLVDFETAIGSGIDDWVARIPLRSVDSACVSIEACASAYSSRALTAYKGNPENLSIMLLTLFELWVAMDKLVVEKIPLLAEYSPEIPLTLLERLLIRKASVLGRLKKLHTYLKARHCQASSCLSVFTDDDDESFAAQYFHRSSKLQSLKARIEADGRKQRQEKLTELRTLHRRYRDLTTRAASLEHEYGVNSRGWDYHKHWQCEKCYVEKEMNSMEITVYEWPLPEPEQEAIVVVFELACPIAFDMWRSMTIHVFVDICTPEKISSTSPFMTLPEYNALRQYRTCHPRQRLTLASEAKPFSRSHYSEIRISTLKTEVCVNNGLNFWPFDTTTGAWVADIPLECDVTKLCTFLLPKGPYDGLQQYLAGTSHTSNQVMANQADCHKDVTIHEFIAFGTLRSGPHLQWMNVLRELHARTLNFRREEIHLLLAQAVSQAGPFSSDDSLIWHEELNSVPFLIALLGELEELMASVEGNWLEAVTIDTIIMLVCRVLSSTQEESVKSRGHTLLRRIRTATFTLLMQLSGKMQASNDEAVSRDLQGRVRDMAVTCRSTFDVDGDASLLLTSNDDIKIFVYCAVMLYDNTPSQLDNLSQYSKLLLERDNRCCHALEPIIRQYVEHHREGLDCAIVKIWDSYRPGTPWRALTAPNSRWLMTQTAPSHSQLPQDVHIDLISGCLLIDGKQLGRLPSKIVQHPTYQSIFGGQVLDIIPADIRGMEYATRGNFCDHQVSFALLDSNDLIIRAKHIKHDSPILQLIPSHKFVEDLPTPLVLRSRDTDLLREISSLSTRRVWYPIHLQKMQTISWSCLAPLAQHHGFHPAAKSIMDYGMKLSTFSEGSANLQELPRFTNHLLERASVRASAIYPDQFSLSLPLGDTDVIYASRDIPDKVAEERAFQITFMVHQWSCKLPVQQNLLDLLTQWQDVQGIGEPLSLQYSKDWLQPSFPDVFLSAYDCCRKATKKDISRLVFTLASLSYSLSDDHALVPTLLAFATVPKIRSLGGPPKFTSYDLSDGFMLSDTRLDDIISSYSKDYENSQERQLPAMPGEDEKTLGRRRYSAFEDRCRSEKQVILSKVQNAWPCENPPALDTLQAKCYNLNELSGKLSPVFRSCWRNRCLELHLDTLQETLRPFYTPNPPSKLPSQYDLNSYLEDSHVASPASSVDAKYLFNRDPPVTSMCGSSQFLPNADRRDLVSSDSRVAAGLQQLINDFRTRGSDKFCRKYADDLYKSRSIYCHEEIVAPPDSTPYTMELLLENHHLHSRQFQDHLHLSHTPSPPPLLLRTRYIMLDYGLELHQVSFSHAWLLQQEILLQLQRSRRLLVFAANTNWVEFFKELESEGCVGFDPELYPDWLLIQIESQFLARPVQVKVALEMMSPCTGGNTSLQLNMGEGKSYVIVPLIAAALSDGHKLVRVIVLKSLSAQMFQLLVERLSGLAQRRIFYIPFSRALSINSSKVQIYRDLMQECMDTKGILVVQPDHILSSQLMAVDRQLSPQIEAAEDMLQTQFWLHNHTCDILDESDEILHVRYQLVYTVDDNATSVESCWKHAARLMSEFPSHSEVFTPEHGGLPFVRVLHSTAGEALVQWIAEDVINSALENINFDQASPYVKEAVCRFVATEKISSACVSTVKNCYGDTTVWPGLLVLRGLLACGILVYALKERRWRVDYGLTQKRTKLAVPFRAKDMPSLRAEFGHPDVAVTLTCLSYYYGGLTLQQLMLCFELLLKQDNPTLEYESWVARLQCIPESLRQLSGINTESAEQLCDLQRLFEFNKAVIDFYLSRVVFPKEAKAFPSKLTCSGWDLAQEKRHITTGFSGTNDNRYLLPSSMVQHDLDYQRSTNARVLAFLLCPENNCYRPIPSGQKIQHFIDTLIAQIPEVRVLLDVGAQMLELKNQELAETWLRGKCDAQAAVFVNDDDEIVVVSRDGTVEPLVSSPFAQQLDQCVVYLDDAHTRGTDVKLPSGFRAAVTLGPKVTKDRLTQGCMRMRKLGNGHSVMFFAPTEVDRSIRSATQKADTDRVDIADILHWAMLETCLDIQVRASHWVQQGSDFSIRHSAWAKLSRTSTSISTLKTAWLQSEARSLEDMYAPRSPLQISHVWAADIQRKCKELGVLTGPKMNMDEEQEREVVHEVEREHQVQRPSKVQSAAQDLHAHVRQFVRTGRIPRKSPAFIPALSSLINTTAEFHEANQWAHNFLVTRDFARTVETVLTMQKADEYLRPVNWIVLGDVGVLVIMSPNEVDALLPDIRNSKAVQLCVYTPRTTNTMKACDDLRLYRVPSTSHLTSSEPLICQLNLFAGQLYFSSYEMYLRTCNFLGLNAPDLRDKDLIADSDGFIRKNRPSARASCSFKRSQVPPLKELFGMRRKGMGYLPTHLGKMFNGRILTEGDFLD
ncbi:uncharacterized protein F5147DRAFT_795623 [Suillus discolor]|uniref:ubiquitinyl hydrolase 1 n=1 Tax=Suillus discolor TaxID=1912936 RepID=A0A9P7JZX1_9AGAM|nr:uncharacterized protein F5147DRAFT_795623 [Suillus discolor]KAG2119627.1 hypothetical protein F5147DRAFT_795623 [Suillus discolor]